MSLLFWYLPLMIMSGAFDTAYQNENHRSDDIPTSEAVPPKFYGWRVMTVRPFNNVQHLRERAELARMQAEQLTDPEAKRMMLGIAESYERLAKRAGCAD